LQYFRVTGYDEGMENIQVLDRVYDFITGEGEQRICDEIPESECHAVPKNFLLNALNGMATKLADQLANPGLVLPWFMDALGVPASLVGFLTPIRRAGSLLPQIMVSGQIRRFSIRKWFWVGGGTVFGLALLLMIPTALLLPALAAGIGILILLGIGSLARGFSSVAFKDVLAKTIPQGRRGTLLAVRATTGGILALMAGIILKLRVGAQQSLTPYLIMIGLAGILWGSSMVLVILIDEQAGATDGSRNPLQEARAGYQLFTQVSGFRKFILARGILLSIELSLPFYALYARQATVGNAGDLGVFVMAASLSQVLSSPFWGRLADRTSRWTLMLSAGMAGLSGVLMVLLNLSAAFPTNIYTLAVPVMVLGFAIAGVRLGRKTYLVDGAPQNERPLYVALSNTVAGMLILLGGGLGVVADAFGVQNLIILLTLLAFAGAASSWRLPEAEDMAKKE
jgi:hypothetical protein